MLFVDYDGFSSALARLQCVLITILIAEIMTHCPPLPNHRNESHLHSIFACTIQILCHCLIYFVRQQLFVPVSLLEGFALRLSRGSVAKGGALCFGADSHLERQRARFYSLLRPLTKKSVASFEGYSCLTQPGRKKLGLEHDPQAHFLLKGWRLHDRLER